MTTDLLTPALMVSTSLTDRLWPGASLGMTSVTELIWLGFTVLLWLLATVYAARTLPDNGKLRRFWTFWALSLSGNLVLIIAQDALSFYVGFSIMSLSAYVLVIHDGTPDARRAGRLYLQLAVLGELTLLAGLLLMTRQNGGDTALAVWQHGQVSALPALLMFVGLGLKAGFWPLHVWLPLAHPAAPAPASAVLSGAMIKAGILGLWKMMPATELTAALADGVLTIAFISALFGALMGLTRTDVKQVLAYSSVSQMGYLLMLLALSWQLPEQRHLLAVALALYAAHHGLVKGTLFMAADICKRQQPTWLIRRLLTIVVAVTAITIAGLPFSSGAAAKSGLKMLLEGNSQPVWQILMIPGAIASTLVMLRALLLMHRQQKQAHYPGQDHLATASWLILALSPWLLVWLWEDSRDLIWLTVNPEKLWSLSWPLLIGVGLSWLAVSLRWRIPTWLTGLPVLSFQVSLWIKHLCTRFSHQRWHWQADLRSLRAIERRWNRALNAPTVNLSMGLLIVVMLVTGILIF